MSSPLPSSAVNIPKVKPLAPSQEIAEEKEINQSLRSQLANANDAYKQLSEEVGKMKTALASREQELARSTRMMSSSSVDDAYSERERGAMSLGSRADQLAAADNANKRIIDQLNGQVDFLNEQLAKREAQAVEAAEKHHQADNIRLELNQR